MIVSSVLAISEQIGVNCQYPFVTTFSLSILFSEILLEFKC